MKPVHVHIHTYDAAFEENKHPRAENGQFGTGGRVLHLTGTTKFHFDEV